LTGHIGVTQALSRPGHHGIDLIEPARVCEKPKALPKHFEAGPSSLISRTAFFGGLQIDS
jgi:hypothetical protein